MEIQGYDISRVYIQAIQAIREKGAIQRDTREIVGLSLVIETPQARILSHPVRRLDLPVVMLAALMAVAGSGPFPGIVVHDPLISDVRELYCGYGIRLRGGERGIDQVVAVRRRITRETLTRQAVVVVFFPEDHNLDSPPFQSPPCPVSFQFLVREGSLHMVSFIRSQSIVALFPYDFFILTFLQESLAVDLGLDLGKYHQYIGSAHYYDAERDIVGHLLGSSHDVRAVSMPPMPRGVSPFEVVREIVECVLPAARQGALENAYALLSQVPTYWQHIGGLAMLGLPMPHADKERILRTLPIYYQKLVADKRREWK